MQNLMTKIWLQLLILLFVGLAVPIAPVLSAERVAMVIGNANYAELKNLDNPYNDARDVADRLKQLGFELLDDEALIDLPERDLWRKVAEFADFARDKEVAFIYYAGHGMQFKSPHILPVDVPKDNLNLVAQESMSLDDLLKQLDGKAKITLAIFDACREIPEYEDDTRASGLGASEFRGLQRIRTVGNSRLIAYSGGSGQLVKDGDTRNSPYTTVLLENLDKQRIEGAGWDVRDLFAQVAWEFRQKHDGQEPEVINQGVQPNTFFLTDRPLIDTESNPDSKPLPTAPDSEVDTKTGGDTLDDFISTVLDNPFYVWGGVIFAIIVLLLRRILRPATLSVEEAIQLGMDDVRRTLSSISGRRNNPTLNDVVKVINTAVHHGAPVYNRSYEGQIGCGRIYHLAAFGLIEHLSSATVNVGVSLPTDVNLAADWLFRIKTESKFNEHTAVELAWELRHIFDAIPLINKGFDTANRRILSVTDPSDVIEVLSEVILQGSKVLSADKHLLAYYLRYCARVFVWLVKNRSALKKPYGDMANELSVVIKENVRIDDSNVDQLVSQLVKIFAKLDA